jgi:hypothetical protein
MVPVPMRCRLYSFRGYFLGAMTSVEVASMWSVIAFLHRRPGLALPSSLWSWFILTTGDVSSSRCRNARLVPKHHVLTLCERAQCLLVCLYTRPSSLFLPSSLLFFFKISYNSVSHHLQISLPCLHLQHPWTWTLLHQISPPNLGLSIVSLFLSTSRIASLSAFQMSSPHTPRLHKVPVLHHHKPKVFHQFHDVVGVWVPGVSYQDLPLQTRHLTTVCCSLQDGAMSACLLCPSSSFCTGLLHTHNAPRF